MVTRIRRRTNRHERARKDGVAKQQKQQKNNPIVRSFAGSTLGHGEGFRVLGIVILILSVVCCKSTSIESQSQAQVQVQDLGSRLGSANTMNTNTIRYRRMEVSGDSDSDSDSSDSDSDSSDSVWLSQPVCSTGDPRTVAIDTSTGDWRFVDDDDNDTPDVTDNDSDNDNDNDIDNDDDDDNNTTFSGSTNTRRMLRNGSDALGCHLFSVDPLFYSTSISMGGSGSGW